MGFVSQVEASRATSSRIGDSSVVVTQSFKPSTKAQELSIRITSLILSKAGIKIGDCVDVLHDRDSDRWMIRRMDGGLKITGKDGAPTGLVRYTLKEGHARFTEDKEHLPIRKSSIEDSLEIAEGQIIFKLK
ncbi:hypothetical protein [Escherichia marmotae]|uniref:hypothetical protein n=1 Tax=Escherichia marmotae TaxID=1499973 RepID=UPI003D95A16B